MAKKLLTVEGFRSSARADEQTDAMVVCAAVGNAEPIADSRRVKFVFSDATIDRAGDSIDPKGWQLTNFLKNPVALFGHDSSNIDSVIGRAVNVQVEGKRLTGEIDFAEADINPKADMAFRMVKAGILSAVSVGFLPLEYAFSTDKDRPYGINFSKQELAEISLVPVPCNPSALVTSKSLGIDAGPLLEWAQRIMDGEGQVPVPRPFLEEVFRAAKTPRSVRQKYLAPDAADASDWRVSAARELAVDASDDNWDGAAAAARIFAAAGFDGDNPDAAKARAGFLIYDAANPSLKSSYKLPFADMVDGELKAIQAGLKAAAGRLPQADAPQEVIEEARAVVAAYEKGGAVEKAGAKISSATAAEISKAIGHHEAGIAALKALIAEPMTETPTGGDPGCAMDPVDMPGDGMKAAERERRARMAHALKIAADI